MLYTHSGYDAVIAEKREQIEQLNKDLDIIDDTIKDIQQVAKRDEILPEHKKDGNERLDSYKQDYLDYFSDSPGISIKWSLGLIKNEILKEKQLLPKSESQEHNTHNEPPVKSSGHNLLDHISSYDEYNGDFE